MHNKNLLYVHLIFVVKYRKPLLTGGVADDIKQYLYEISTRHHWYIIRMESDRDHIHVLLQYPPGDSISRIVTTLKGYSTWHIWQCQSRMLKQHFWKEHTFWSDGYFAASVGNASKSTIEYYIENQG